LRHDSPIQAKPVQEEAYHGGVDAGSDQQGFGAEEVYPARVSEHAAPVVRGGTRPFLHSQDKSLLSMVIPERISKLPYAVHPRDRSVLISRAPSREKEPRVLTVGFPEIEFKPLKGALDVRTACLTQMQRRKRHVP
jgi:hypothetical protein